MDAAAPEAREAEGLLGARRFGIHVPRLLDHDRRGPPWTGTEVVPGTPMALRRPSDVPVFLNVARRLTARLHARRVLGGPGTGWSGPSKRSNSQPLARQLSAATSMLEA